MERNSAKQFTYHADDLQLPSLPVPAMAVGIDEVVVLPFVVGKAAKRDEPAHVDEVLIITAMLLSEALSVVEMLLL